LKARIIPEEFRHLPDDELREATDEANQIAVAVDEQFGAFVELDLRCVFHQMLSI
jgi:diadenosine tetraphosphate (Ap4A) HIT family hydrolase